MIVKSKPIRVKTSDISKKPIRVTDESSIYKRNKVSNEQRTSAIQSATAAKYGITNNSTYDDVRKAIEGINSTVYSLEDVKAGKKAQAQKDADILGAYGSLLQEQEWAKEYEGKSYDEIKQLIDIIPEGTDGKLKKWLTEYAPTIMKKADYDAEIYNIDDKIGSLEAVIDQYDSYKYSTGEYTQAWYRDFAKKYGSRSDVEAKIEELKASKWDYENKKKYNSVSQNEDFAEKSGYVSTAYGDGFSWDKVLGSNEYGLGYKDLTYEYINNIDNIRDEINYKHSLYSHDGIDTGSESKYERKGYDYLEKDEIAVYNYLYQTEGAEAAQDYLDYMEIELGKRKTESNRQFANKFAGTLPVLASATSVPLNLQSGLGFIDVAYQNLEKNIKEAVTGEYAGPINYNTSNMQSSVMSGTIRETVAQNIANSTGVINIKEDKHPILSKLLNGKSLGDVYQLGMSMVDSAAVALMSPVVGTAGTALLGGSAATQGMLNAVKAGATDEQALWMGVLNGGFEMLFEKYELENLLGADSNVLKGIINQALTEGIGEGATTIANTLADVFVMAENSEWQKSIDAYIANGYSPQDAEKQAFWDAVIQVGWDAVGGMLSGGIMSGSRYAGEFAYGAYQNRKFAETKGSDIINAGHYDALIEAAKAKEGDKVLSKMIERTEKAEAGSGKRNVNTGKLFRRMYGDSTTDVFSSQRRAIAEDLTEKGVKNAEAIATAVDKQINEEELTLEDKKLLNTEEAKAVLAEVQDSESALSKRIAEKYAEAEKKLSEIQKIGRTKTNNGVKIGKNGLKAEDIVSIKRDKAHNIVEVTTEEGTFKADDVMFSSDIADTMDSIHYIEDDEAASTYIKSYTGPANAMEFDIYYSYGAANLPFATAKGILENSKLSEDDSYNVYRLGAERASRDVRAKQDAISKIEKLTEAKKGSIDTSKLGNIDSLTPRQQASIAVAKEIARVTGVDIVFFKSKAKNGKYVGENGRYENGKIYLDINAGLNKIGDEDAQNAIVGTMAHELTHFIKEWSAEKYDVLEKFLFEKYNEHGDLDKALANTMARLGLDPRSEEDRAVAREEFVANCCEKMLNDSQAIKELAEKDQGLGKAIVNWFKKFAKKLKAAVKGMEAYTEEGAFFEKFEDTFKELQKLWDDALVDAATTYKFADTSQEIKKASTEKDEGKHQDRYEKYDKPITASDVETLRSIGRKSINDFTSEDIQKAQKWAYKFYKTDKLGVKSPFFRAWFGDWRAEQKDSYIPILSVVNLEGKNPRGIFVNNDTKWEISSSSVGYDETVSHSGKDKLSLLAMRNIDQIIENAILLDTEISEYGRGKKSIYTAFMHKFYAPIKIDGKVYIAKMAVDESYSPGQADTHKKFYHVRSIKIEASSSVGIGDNHHTPIIEDVTSKISISDLFALVKEYDEEFKPKPVNKILLNDDGTPKVFYHGTNEKFTTFSYDEMAPMEGSFFFAENKEDAEAYGDNVYEVYLTGNNLADYDNQPSEFYKLRNKRAQVEYLKERGYDGWYADMDSDGWGEISVFSQGQIKSATDNIGTFDKAESDIRYSARYDKEESARSIIANTLESVATTDAEREILARYKEKLSTMEKKEAKLKEKRAELNELRYTKGKRTPEMKAKMASLASEIAKLENSIRTFDDRLLRMENTQFLRELVSSHRKKGWTDASIKYREKIREGVENRGRKAGIEKAERHLKELLTMLNNPTDKKHIPTDLETPLRRFLEMLSLESSYKLTKPSVREKMAEDQRKLDAARSKLQSAKNEDVPKLQKRIAALEEDISYQQALLNDITLSEKQTMFVERWVADAVFAISSGESFDNDKALKDAALAAGYSEKQSKWRGSSLLYSQKVQDNIKNIVNDNSSLSKEQKDDILSYLPAETNEDETYTNKAGIDRRNEYWKKRLQDIGNAIEKSGENSNVDFDAELKTEIDNFAETVGNTSLYEMSGSQLAQLNHIFRVIKTSIKNIDRALSLANGKKISELSNGFYEHNKDYTYIPTGKGREAIRKMRDFDMLNAYYYGELLGPEMETVMDSLGKGQEDTYMMIRQLDEFVNEIKGKHGDVWNAVSKGKPKVYIVNNGNAKISLTKGQLLGLYLLIQQSDAKSHILAKNGGIAPDSEAISKAFEMTMPKKKDIFNKKTAVEKKRLTAEQRNDILKNVYKTNLTEEDLDMLVGQLSSEEKAFAREIQEFVSGTVSEWGNKTSRKMFGYNKFTKKDYWPIVSNALYLKKLEENAMASTAWCKEMGFTKNRVPEATNPIIVEDILDTLVSHSIDMAKYAGMRAPISDAIRFINSDIRNEDGSVLTTVKEAMNKAYGPNAENFFTNLIKDLNGIAGDTRSSELLQTLLRHAKIASVSNSARVAIQQPVAYFKAAFVLDADCLAKGIAITPKEAMRVFERAQKYNGLAYAKSTGTYGIGLSRSEKDKLLDRQSVKDWVQDIGMWVPGKMDELTWGSLWLACEKQVKKNNPDMKVGSEDFYKVVSTLFSEVINKTQVIDTPMNKAAMMRSNDSALKRYTAFMNEPIGWAQIAMSQLNELRHGGYKDKKTLLKVAKNTGKFVAVFAVQNVVLTFVQSLADAWRDDDEYEEFWKDKFLSAAQNNLINNLWPHSWFPLIGDIFEEIGALGSYLIGASDTMGGSASASIDEQGVSKLIDFLESFVRFCEKAEKGNVAFGDAWKLTKGGVDAVSNLFGIGAKGALREIEALVNNIFDWIGYEESLETIGVDTKSGEIKAAFLNGYYDSAKKRLNEYLSQKSEEYREKDGLSASEAEKKAKSGARSSITRWAKEEYIKLCWAGESTSELRNQLISLNIGYTRSTFESWGDEYKERKKKYSSYKEWKKDQ